ncbi:hypothetical protein HD597_000193 [Nonomuraea thailandensis]|uniref:Helix-turn-helix domain-containing protein n=1 Tax=Nonomuraea thailandensis TaxID=1188745 RepID=A0A9X2GFL4_9ACTN|nr:hypothetical protein [Nonomuraea thailandensis]MCP2353173.1 hypothetical protein [Nonomuraea thailandensis]
MENTGARSELDAAAARIAEALGATLAELADIAAAMTADDTADDQDRLPGDVLLLALAEVVRRGPERHDLVGAVEAGEILGVSRTRVHQLADPDTGHRDFPRPRYHLAAGKLWARADIVAFDQRWDRRRTGRPRKSQ